MEKETIGGPFSFPSNVPDLSSVFTDNSDDEIDNEDFDNDFDEAFEDISDEEFEYLGDDVDEGDCEEADSDASESNCGERLADDTADFDDFDELNLDEDTFDDDNVLPP